MMTSCMNLVIDIDNSRVKAAFFQDNQIRESFGGKPEELRGFVKGKKLERTLISSVNEETAGFATKILQEEGIKFERLKADDFEKRLNVIDKKEIGTDRIANIYGALYHFPSNDCIVIDIGVKTLATGDMTENKEFSNDLSDFVDCVDPHLTLMGLNEVLKGR